MATCLQSAAGMDSLFVLNESVYLDWVRKFHPVVRQSDLRIAMGKEGMRKARGEFDPELSYTNLQKTFDGKNYFNYNQSEIRIPTRLGLQIYGGLENNFGDLVNDEVTLDKSSYLGARVPLLKNLIIDKRRAALAQAKFAMRQSGTQKQMMLNDLFLEARSAYWDWTRDYQILNLLAELVKVNDIRFQAVKESFLGGDRAALDTLEAYSQLQGFAREKEAASLQFRKSTLELSVFLWDSAGQPAYLTRFVLPDTTWPDLKLPQLNLLNTEFWIQPILENHPEIQNLDMKLRILEVEKKLKFQELLPTADLKYNYLRRGFEPWKSISGNMFENNYKFGINLIVPIPNRSGIGEYKAAGIRLNDAEWDRSMKLNQLSNKIKFNSYQLLNIMQQRDLTSSLVSNYKNLLEAESMKFRLGESSVFLINTRENKYLEESRKLVDLKAKFLKSYASLIWTMGSDSVTLP
jgi:outer membrane protein TolC